MSSWIQENLERKKRKTEEKEEEEKEYVMEESKEDDCEWICNNCGKPAQGNCKHCKNCGTSLLYEDEEMESKDDSQEDNKRKDCEASEDIQNKRHCIENSNSSSSSGSTNKRNIEETDSDSRKKIMRTEGESQGEIAMIMNIDSIAADDWEEEKQNLRELKVPFVIIKGNSKARAMEISKIHDMFGEYYIWEMPKRLQDSEILAKMNYIGGEGVLIDDTEVWSNSKKVASKLRETLVMRDIRRNIRGKSETNQGSSWGSIPADAMGHD